jgi:hypothetical protein
MAGVTSFILAVAFLALFTALDSTMVAKYSQPEGGAVWWPLKWMTQELSNAQAGLPQEFGMVELVTNLRFDIDWLHLGATLQVSGPHCPWSCLG